MIEMLFAGAAGALPCLFFAAVATLIVGGIIWAIISARKRREEYERLAAELGCRYYPDDPWDLPARYAHFDLFSTGHGRKAANVLAGGLDGRSALAFDYQYSTGSGKNETTHHFQVAVLEMPITAPALKLRDESFLDTIASWVGHDDIDFESAEFSKRYHVKCTERKFAYDIFHARLIEYLLACGNAPGMEFKGPLLVLSQTLGGPEQARRLLEIGREIIRSIPEYVLHERGIGVKAGGQQ